MIKRRTIFAAIMAVLLVSTSFSGADEREDLVAGEMLRGQQLVDQLHLTEVLGPLAPIALSPYFGLMCLSIVSIFVTNGTLPENAFLNGNPILNNEAVLVALIVLTLLTSLPRFTKVSKAFAQATDLLETYSSIIALGVIYVLPSHIAADTAWGHDVVVHAGILSLSRDALVLLAVALNIIVINTIKFFFEMLILFSPIPAIDAFFECLNKATAAGMMALYVFSPFAATILNTIIFLGCFAVFKWFYRRANYYRTLLIGLLWKSTTFPPKATCCPTKDVSLSLPVFVKKAPGEFKRLERCYFVLKEGHMSLVQPRLLGEARITPIPNVSSPALEEGLLQNNLKFGDEVSLAFSKHFDHQLKELAEMLHTTYEVLAQDVSRGLFPNPDALKQEH